MATEIDEYRLSERRYRVPDRTSTDLNTEILEIRRVETPYSQNRRAETPYSQVSWTEHVSRRATVDGTERTASSDHWGGVHGNFGRPVGAFVDNGRDSRTQRIVHVHGDFTDRTAQRDNYSHQAASREKGHDGRVASSISRKTPPNLLVAESDPEDREGVVTNEQGSTDTYLSNTTTDQTCEDGVEAVALDSLPRHSTHTHTYTSSPANHERSNDVMGVMGRDAKQRAFVSPMMAMLEGATIVRCPTGESEGGRQMLLVDSPKAPQAGADGEGGKRRITAQHLLPPTPRCAHSEALMASDSFLRARSLERQAAADAANHSVGNEAKRVVVGNTHTHARSKYGTTSTRETTDLGYSGTRLVRCPSR
eukprot:Tamp_09176.p1 GENE.Tamp_09176~~Tamp_09176.p1  ORF type:complete len:365 (+),score=8.87 Tamp_09176:950-2044(+)